MSEQPQQQQPTSKAPVIMYLVVWFLFMIWLSLPEGESFAKALWNLFAGGVILVELVLVGGWILKKIL